MTQRHRQSHTVTTASHCCISLVFRNIHCKKRHKKQLVSVHKQDLIQRFVQRLQRTDSKKTTPHLRCASCYTVIISFDEKISDVRKMKNVRSSFQRGFTRFLSTPGESERRCCSPSGCSAALWRASSPAVQENKRFVEHKQPLIALFLPSVE